MPTANPSVTTVLAKLAKVRSVGDGWLALCPAHEDQRHSLSIGTGKDGRVLLNCHAGCSVQSIVSAIGLTTSDLFATPRTTSYVQRQPLAAPRPTTERPSVVTSYAYTDEDGEPLYEVCRMEPKDFRQRRRLSDGSWEWKLGDVRRVLYRLPEVIEAAAHERPIYLVEGEKDADTLSAESYCATTWAGGANAWRDTYADALRGCTVYCLPDNDEPGQACMQQAAAALTAKGARVKVVPLPDLPPKGDVSDWVASGHTLDELDELVEKAPLWHPDPANRTRWRLDELWQNDSIMRPPPPVVPRIAWAGRSTLLASREKAGKSTLTGYVAAQVSRGGMFLNDPCERGDVLIVGLEEFIGDTARRLRQFRADPERVHLVDRFRGDPQSRPQEIAAHVEAVSPVLVIVDTLAAYWNGVVTDSNNASQTQPVVQGLTQLAHDAGCALILIHHAKKSDGRYRDSTAIGGAVDVIVEVLTTDPDTDPTKRKMCAVGRVPVPPFTEMRFNGNDYSLASELEAPIDQRVLAYVQSHPTTSANAVSQAIGGRSEVVKGTIAKLLASGALKDMSGDNKGYKLVVSASIAPSLVPDER